MSHAAGLIYLLCAACFIIGLKLLSSPLTARRGNLLSALGMLLAIITTLLDQAIVDFRWIMVGVLVGGTAGTLMARLVGMTAMPQMVAMLNGFGGLASLMVAWETYERNKALDAGTAATVVLAVVIGGVTFTGSVIAWAKLAEKMSSRPLQFPAQQLVNGVIAVLVLVGAILFVMDPEEGRTWFLGMMGLALVAGVMSVIPIGGADMPVVISLLNSYSGLAACATGFVLRLPILVVTGALVGASGLILTRLMCKAMNRSLTNVLFGGFGAVIKSRSGPTGVAKDISGSDAYILMEAARSVVVVPGYGLAVAQAQHILKDLGEQLENNGAEVRYAIHPVAGRMPGHMNVLLAEAEVPYEQLFEMNAINPLMDSVDLCLVIGANDVVNPAAAEDQSSPIYGMPIIQAERARTVVVLKRTMASGFAGIDNPLFFRPNTRMLFGDAKASLQTLVAEFKP